MSMVSLIETFSMTPVIFGFSLNETAFSTLFTPKKTVGADVNIHRCPGFTFKSNKTS